VISVVSFVEFCFGILVVVDDDECVCCVLWFGVIEVMFELLLIDVVVVWEWG